MAKILLVEDNEDMALLVSDGLSAERHIVESFGDGLEAMEALRMNDYDVIILDWQLPGMSGLDILKNYRSAGGSAPVVMLTGKGAIAEKEQGLDSGADDYVTKPFDVRELAARVRSLLRRPRQMASEALICGDLMLDPVRFRIARGDKELRLLPRDFALLEFLMRHPTEIFSVDTLLARVWHYDSDATPDGVRMAISRIRKVVDDGDKSASIIENVARVGYRLRQRFSPDQLDDGRKYDSEVKFFEKILT
ncbi:MAG: response regulator transcription factor [Candidatus Melainabacteria bacterium]|nr:response regulator transcription factor [Candidatus Melainabacteria bacterium]